ncbi:MAG: class I SAM-dependent methyltransferase [Anaerolineae bacterium]
MKLVFSTRQRTAMIDDLIANWLQPNDRVLDLGTGSGFITRHLQNRGYIVTAVDVRNTSRCPEITPLLYDGLHLPFAKDSFDVCLLSTVLHHTPQPDLVIAEAMRVARRIIVIEDIYRTQLGRWSAIVGCSLANKQFRNHPHSNRSDADWQATFSRLGLEILEARYVRELSVVIPFFHGAYLAQRRHVAAT